MKRVLLGLLAALGLGFSAHAQVGGPGYGLQPLPGCVASVACQAGSISFIGIIPTVAGTGTPTIAAGSTDAAGEVTSGASATSVTITFSSVKTNAPFCVVSPQSVLLVFSYTISTSAITITQTATSGEKIDYHCFQH